MACTKWAVNLSIFWICIAYAIACEDCSDLSGDGYATVSYSVQDADVINPERGGAPVYQSFGDAALGSTSPLTTSILDTALADYGTISLIWREYYLDVTTTIEESYLEVIQGDMDTLRANGFKGILRFGYTSNKDYTGSTELSKDKIEGHITQLTSKLVANADVILSVQLGFIGLYGEWYHTTEFGDYGDISDDEQADRNDIITAVLAALPASRSVQLRTPAYKVAFTANEGHLVAADFSDGDETSRIGHYSNCFLYNSTDAGTYSDIVVDKAYLEAETKYVLMGGETCGANPPSTECASAKAALAMFHYTYLNIAGRDADKVPDTSVIDSWETGNCYEEILKKLGYRLRLVSAILPLTATKNGDACFSITLRNDGYAAPIHPRDVKIILRLTVSPFTNYTSDAITEFNDARPWQPNEDIPIVFSLKLDVPEGDYDVLLELADPLLSGVPAYNILLLNQNVSELETGLNNLKHVIQVTEASGTGTCSGLTVKPITNSSSAARCASGCSGFRYTPYTPSMDATTDNGVSPQLLIGYLTLCWSLAIVCWL